MDSSLGWLTSPSLEELRWDLVDDDDLGYDYGDAAGRSVAAPR
jgi:hypothetical protein